MDFYFWRESVVRDMDTALERARAGAAYLDARHGNGWDAHVDAGKLDIASPFHCVLGQLALAGTDNWLSIDRSVDLGFSCGLFSDLLSLFTRFPTLRQSYERLNEAWRIVLAERQENGAAIRPAAKVATPARTASSAPVVVG